MKVFPHTACMKKFLKIIPCILASVFVLMGTAACKNGVSDMRRRERVLKERLMEEKRLSEETKQTLEEDELDPGFSVDPETDPEDKKENPDRKKCPDCPKNSENRPNELLPEYGKPHHGKRISPKPVPFPVPPEEPEN